MSEKIEHIKNALKTSDEVVVVFTKSDGTERTMRCTIDGERIPADKAPKGTAKNLSEDTQRVFDLDKGEWRSFKFDAVKTISIQNFEDSAIVLFDAAA